MMSMITWRRTAVKAIATWHINTIYRKKSAFTASVHSLGERNGRDAGMRSATAANAASAMPG